MNIFDIIKKRNTVVSIPLSSIVPNPAQPRRSFDQSELASLSQSILENGLIQPISVRNTESGFQVIAGERRLEAHRILGKAEIEAIVYDISDAESALWALTENLQRSDLSIFDEAEGIAALLTVWGISREEAAKRLGKAPSTISNKLRLLRLPDDMKEKILKNELSERHARALLKLPTDDARRAALDYIIEKNLNVGQTENLVLRKLCPPEKEPVPRKKMAVRDVRLFLNTIEHAIDVMKLSGIEAVSTVLEHDDFIEYTVRVPRRQAYGAKVNMPLRT